MIAFYFHNAFLTKATVTWSTGCPGLVCFKQMAREIKHQHLSPHVTGSQWWKLKTSITCMHGPSTACATIHNGGLLLHTLNDLLVTSLSVEGFGRIDPDRRPLTHIPHSVFRIHLWTFRFFFEGVNHHSQCKDDTHKSYTRACRDDPCCSPFSLTFQRAQAVKNVFSSFSALGSAFALCARLLCLG